MASGLSGTAGLARMVRFVRYWLSPPSFDALGSGVLMVVPNPAFRRLRLFAIGAAALVAALQAVTAMRGGALAGDTLDAALAVAFAVGLWAVLTLMPKRLVAKFGEQAVEVYEGGIRRPRLRWTAPVADFTGLAWRFYRATETTETVESMERTRVRRRAAPLVIEFHWIELVHPDPAKVLVLRLQRGDAGMDEALDLYARRLGRPVLARREEDLGATS